LKEIETLPVVEGAPRPLTKSFPTEGGKAN